MEGDLQPSPDLGYLINNDDANYVRLSTIMVATIQEVKDRISQIEYIFCSQLFPELNSRPKRLLKRFTEAMKAAEDVWRKKETQFLMQIEELQLEKSEATGKHQNAEAIRAAEDGWIKKESWFLTQIEELQLEKRKALEENHNLVASLTEKAKSMSAAEDNWKQKETLLQSEITELRNQKGKALEQNKNAEAMKAADKGWRKNEAQFLIQIEELQFKNEKLFEENQKLVASLEEKAKSVGAAEGDWKWKETLLKFEIEGLHNKKQKLLEENQDLVDSLKMEKTASLQNEQLLNECKREKILLVEKLENSQKIEEVAELQSQLTQKAEEVAAEKQIQENLLQQIRLKDIEMKTERKKHKTLFDMYKKLKSQYNFICNKFGLHTESSLPNHRMEDESILSKSQQAPKITHGCTDGNQQIPSIDSKMNEPKENRGVQVEDDTVSMLNENSGSHLNIKLPSASSSRRPKCAVSVKSESLAGRKRPVPHWRDTRGPREAGGADPHDDFLSTPLEIVKGQLNKSLKEEVHDFPVPPPKDMDFNSSDDETQDLNVDHIPQKQQNSAIRTGDKSFKYVEPVRKKADRDNLKGFECKQCKKFYDAVLPDNGKNGENKNTNFRCEHHDGVSRHRYRYVPPSTPEGFWNIGFESEIFCVKSKKCFHKA